MTTFDGVVGHDSFLNVANTGQIWSHDDALLAKLTKPQCGEAQFIGWPVQPGTGFVKSVLLEHYYLYPPDTFGFPIDYLVCANPEPLMPAALQFGGDLVALGSAGCGAQIV